MEPIAMLDAHSVSEVTPVAVRAKAAPAQAEVPSTRWDQRYAQRAQRITSSTIRELLKLTEQPDLISFAGGMPAPDVFPLIELDAAAHRVLGAHGTAALQYSMTEGYRPLREFLARRMERHGIRVTPDNVLITTGSQQALDLVGRLFINPGDRLLVEEPTYLGALQAWNQCQAEYVTVPIDDDGLRTDQLESALRVGPKFMYVLPNFQNPGGTTLSFERRRRVVELAAHYGTPIIEDDPYDLLRYEGQPLPPLVKFDADLRGGTAGSAFTGDVIYMSTLSKLLAPGLRVGWVVAPEPVIKRLVQVKQGTDLHTSTLCQMVAYEVVRDGFLDRHVHSIRAVYGERRNAMLAALERYFPEEVSWTRPAGGLFLWVTLPAPLDSGDLLARALERKVAFVPGVSFYAQGGGTRTLRLNFSFPPPDVIDDGIRRLGEVIKARLTARA